MGEKIEIRDADIGAVIARADHHDFAIEVNSNVFYRLPPLLQEFILCHEVCHLIYGERNEARTNILAKEVFLKRAYDEEDRRRREEFFSYVDARGFDDFSWAAIVALIPAVANLSSTIYYGIKARNAGWYGWNKEIKAANLNTMLVNAFENARRSSNMSASQFFWEEMRVYTFKDNSVDDFLSRNNWVRNVIASYEQKYGFGFKEIKPADITAFPIVIIAVGVLLGLFLYKLLKRRKK